jgi:glycosyltransferase involved in cell wall biosynthesis
VKNVLIVSYHFPPLASMGAIRMARFVRHLEGTGWCADILTAGISRFRVQDSDLNARLPECLRIFRESTAPSRNPPAGNTEAKRSQFGRRSLRPGGIAKRSAEFLRRWAPPTREPLAWRRAALSVGRRLIRSNRYQLIYSSSGPMACHLVAGGLVRNTNIPWVAEFRDALVDNPYLSLPTPWHRRYYSRHENAIIRCAASVIVTTHAHKQVLQERYGEQAPIHVLSNGFDPSEYPARVEGESGTFVVSYAGSLYGERSIEPVLRGWKEWSERQFARSHRVRLRIYGQSFNADLAGAVHDLGLEASVEVCGLRSHAQAMEAISASDAVLVIKSPVDLIHIPGKLYESLGAGRPVLLVGPESEASRLIRTLDAGVVVSSPGPRAIADALDEIVLRTNRSLAPPQEFAIESLTTRLSEIFTGAASCNGIACTVNSSSKPSGRLEDYAH